MLTGSGFADAWNTNPLTVLDPDGSTCCQQADLANRRSLLDERIDLIFVRNAGSFELLALEGFGQGFTIQNRRGRRRAIRPQRDQPCR